jgi:DNA polymerase III subunit epsilon
VRASNCQPPTIGAVSKTVDPVLAADPAGEPLNGGVVADTPSPPAPLRFAALDFETADYGRDSACALSIVIVENDAIIDAWTNLIRPPRRDFCFTYLHGIAWEHVKNKPSFGELWGEITSKLAGVSFVAAHNASFDRSVLRACCEAAALVPVQLPFVCTVKAARSILGYYPTTLADVCRQLQIPLRHHDAESDARACARILLAARERGHAYDRVLTTCALKPARARRSI